MNQSAPAPSRPKPWETHLQALRNPQPGEVRSAITSLVADKENRAQILDDLIELIDRLSAALYGPIPKGLRAGESEKYDEIAKAATAQQAAIQAALGILGPRALLDESRWVQAVDKSGMLQRLGRWPDHVATMRTEALRALAAFRDKYGSVRPSKVQVFGLGGSGAPHDIAAQVISNFRKSRVPLEVIHADDPNPDFTDENTLAIFSSFSGNTEETLNCYQQVHAKAGALLALGQGGELRTLARRDGIPFMQLPEDPQHPAHVLQPRESVCLQLTGMLCFLAGLGLPAGSAGSLTLEDLDIDGAIAHLHRWSARFEPATPFDNNPAKQLALFLLYGVADAAGAEAVRETCGTNGRLSSLPTETTPRWRTRSGRRSTNVPKSMPRAMRPPSSSTTWSNRCGQHPAHRKPAWTTTAGCTISFAPATSNPGSPSVSTKRSSTSFKARSPSPS